MAPKYLAELCRPISDVQGRRHLRSAARGLLLTPRSYLSTYGRRAFSYADPSAWNSLPEHLRAPDLTLNSFRHSLKTFLFTQMTHAAHYRLLVIVGYTSLLFTFTFTLLSAVINAEQSGVHDGLSAVDARMHPAASCQSIQFA